MKKTSIMIASQILMSVLIVAVHIVAYTATAKKAESSHTVLSCQWSLLPGSFTIRKLCGIVPTILDCKKQGKY